MDELKLYYSPSCPYCLKVLRFMEKNGIALERASVSDPDNLKRLTEVGGKHQVPCLFIDGKPLYESNDIIEYLRTRFANA